MDHHTDLGLQEHRLDGEEYISVVDEFMEAVFSRWPNVIVQVKLDTVIVSQKGVNTI